MPKKPLPSPLLKGEGTYGLPPVGVEREKEKLLLLEWGFDSLSMLGKEVWKGGLWYTLGVLKHPLRIL
ncbi:hypothetical protein BDGGKGIB_02822 [Nodularia sphaerocarpa UHCC 0038]|nr:hypothetical protein BDGGKGIB_02822 [Nodularia sphaerocarpa UHCC 0038]